MKQVLHLGRVGYLGGAERVALTILSGLGGFGWRGVLAAPPGDFLEIARRRSIVCKACGWGRFKTSHNPLAVVQALWHLFGAARQVDRMVGREPVSVVHVHHPVMALVAALPCRRRKVPLLLHLHDGPPATRLYLMTLALALRAADRVVSVSGAGLELATQAGRAALPIEIVPNAVDYEFDSHREAQAPAISGAPFTIATFGVIEPRKGMQYLIEAMPAIVDRIPSARLRIFGEARTASDKRYLRTLRDLCTRLRIADAVLFEGNTSEVARMMSAAHVVVLPSVSHESLSMVVLEALYLGTPVVATEIGGIREAIRNGVNGCVVPPRDPRALADAVCRLEVEGEAMRARAQADARVRFAPNVMVGRFCALYDELAARS